ncbi:MAG: adenosylcobinamide-phosphate synthase [Granulosicoccus sp.]|jgi:adenosylcobinamide-phosphate synthase
MSIFDSSIAYSASLLILALILELLFGWPAALFERIRHPVVWIGALISFLEKHFNRASSSEKWRKLCGMLSTILVVAVTAILAWALSTTLPNNLIGLFVEALLASSLLAARSLYEHVYEIFRELANNDLTCARKALSKIVGRDTQHLDEHAISGAALESLAENASDGFIAPVFWGVLLGLPGLAAYKAINTLDSMIGHKTDRYKSYGRFAAQLDDVVNLIPARLTALLFWFCARMRPSFNAIAAQAKHHRSPNAGWPESAMAFALGVKLSGPRQYATGLSNEPWLNEAGNPPGVKELGLGLRLYSYAIGLVFVAIGMVWVVFSLPYLASHPTQPPKLAFVLTQPPLPELPLLSLVASSNHGPNPARST